MGPRRSTDVALALQAVYADLVDRAAAAGFEEAFAEAGLFTPKIVRGKRYWYFQPAGDAGRRQRYVGPETPDLLERIARHRAERYDEKDRRSLVSTLTRSGMFPRPAPAIGAAVAALARAGVFRLRGVLVGTLAYQIYGPMLGVRLPGAAVETSDVDIAQLADVSVAIDDRAAPLIDALREVDGSFRHVPHSHDGRRAASLVAAGGLRIDFITPNRGRDTDAPTALPALGMDAQPLRFLDFLLRDPEPAVMLHGAGIPIVVPSPHRFALHKLIVARRRPEGAAKRGKDLVQADSLLSVLVEKRPDDLAAAWAEAFSRGATWRRLIGEGLGGIGATTRDLVLRLVGAPRSTVPGLDLRFASPAARHDHDRLAVTFVGEVASSTVRCAVSEEALADHFGADARGAGGMVRCFRAARAAIEALVRSKYLEGAIDAPEEVVLTTTDVAALLPGTKRPRPRRPQ